MTNISHSALLQYTKTILDEKTLNLVHCVIYGSHVYGTATSKSDWDIYCIVAETSISIDIHNNDSKIDLTIRSKDLFEKDVKSGQPLSVEVLLTPKEFILFHDEKYGFIKTMNLNSAEIRKAIRHGFSEKASWSEVRARKKLNDKEILCALKSLYHSYRILGFGIQIGSHGMITDWSFGKNYLDELLSLDPNVLNDQEMRISYKKWAKTGCNECMKDSVQTQFKIILPK